MSIECNDGSVWQGRVENYEGSGATVCGEDIGGGEASDKDKNKHQ